MWYEAVQHLASSNEDYVLITVLATRGSTPRDCGTKMVVSRSKCYQTIGGGNLEYKAIDRARELLQKRCSEQKIEQFPLGAKLGQCCGGHATLMFESYINSNIDIMVFGAGHVGRALVSMLSQLPCRIHWVDSREDEFPKNLANNVNKIVSESPKDEVATMSANTYFVVMTHNHSLDFDICEAILLRNDAGYVGLIGSETKWKRFQMRFKHKGYKDKFFSSIRCPVGLSNVPGKLPGEVAVSVAGEIISQYHLEYQKQPHQYSLSWKSLQGASLNNKNLSKTNKDIYQ
jgi:xanthine dehydrogenase accessory factor